MLKKLKIRSKELKREIVSLFLVYKRKETPLGVKLFIAIIVSYALSPIDIIPDFIPILGYLDDLILLPIGIALAIKFVPEDIMNECRIESEGLLKDNLPRNWIAGAVIIIIWIIITLKLIILI